MPIGRVRLRIAGQWEDGWLYRGYLILWHVDGSVVAAEVEAIRRYLEKTQSPHLSFLVDQLVLRSERKKSQDFRGLLALPTVAHALLEPLRVNSDQVIDITAVQLIESGFGRLPGRILDTQIYGSRIFGAGEQGVFEAQFNPKYPSSGSPLLQLTDVASTSISAGVGRISAALGEEGLVSRDVTFGRGSEWWADAEQQNRNLEVLSPYSQRVSRSSVHLLNYTDSAGAPEFLYPNRVRRSEGRFEEDVVSDYRRAYSLVDPLTEIVGISDPDEDVRVFGNANFRLIAGAQGRNHVVDIQPNSRHDVTLRRDKKFVKTEHFVTLSGRPMSVHAIDSGIAVETLEQLSLLSPDGMTPIVDSECVQVRTFPNSRRYTDTIIAVQDEHVDILGFIAL